MTATDDVVGDLTPDCTPASRTRFATGTTTVTCTATDGKHTSEATFEVEVTKPTAAQLAEMITALAKRRRAARQGLPADDQGDRFIDLLGLLD